MGTRHYAPDVEGSLSVKTVVKGAAVWQAAARIFPLVENQYLILNDRQRYTITVDSITPVSTFCVFFARGFVEDVFRSTVTDSATLLDDPAGVPALGFFEKLEMGGDAVTAAVEDLRTAIGRGLGHDGQDEYFRRIAEALVEEHQNTAAAVARIHALRFSTRQELYRRLTRGRDFLLSSLDSGSRLREAARAACLSPYHFHRAFTRVFGETPHACHVRHRLNRAARLLGRGDRSVLDVCLESGFESPASFSTLFRKRFGLSPSQVRGQIRKIR